MKQHRASANMKPFRRLSRAWIILVALATMLTAPASHGVRIKDITHIQGIRTNQLIGYGLVVGLNDTGDGTSADFTLQSLAGFLSRNNIKVDPEDLQVDNVAAVIVTAELPPFARPGDKIDVHVSSIGDAESLEGGTLAATPLFAGRAGEAFAIAQGPVSIGGFGAAAGGTSVQKNHLTAGKIPGGATVERPSPVILEGREEIRLMLKNPDFTTAQRIAEVINHGRENQMARSLNSAEVSVQIPHDFRRRIPEFLASIERLPVHPDQKARIVIDERTGTVVMGEDVRISTIALAHGSLTIQITEVNQVSQPEGFSLGETTPVTNTGVSLQEEDRQLAVLNEGVSLGEVVRSLNAVGVTPRDLIAILQSIKALGALQAELVIQ